MKNISILDLGISNLFSIEGLFNKLGYKTRIIKSSVDFKNIEILVIPGVGTFPAAMKYLDDQNLIEKIKNHFINGKPLIGICLGMQLLFDHSTEFGKNKGLGLIKGEVKKFSKGNLKTHIGWNRIYFNKENIFFKNQKEKNLEDNYFYFVHSYYPTPKNKDLILSYSNFNSEKFCSSIYKNNLLAMQFHPEKSSENGIKLIENFLKIVDKND